MSKIKPYWLGVFSYLKSTSVGRWQKVAMIAALVYVVFPLDLVPDFIPIFGWLEDLGIGTLATMWLTWSTHAFAMKQLSQGAAQPDKPELPTP